MKTNPRLHTVKVISIRQPWASLVIMGIKDVENRTWTTPYRGPIYIHASQKFDSGAMDYLEEFGDDLLDNDVNNILRILPEQPRGALIGRVTLKEIVPFDEYNVDALSRWHFDDNFGWYLTDPEVLKTPIPMKGRLGLYSIEVPSSALRTVRRSFP